MMRERAVANRKRLTYFALSLAVFCTLDYGDYLAQGTFLSRWTIDLLTVRPAAAIINVVLPSAAATANGHSLFSPFGQLNILPGCEGTEAMFLLLAAVLPYPAPWRRRLIGVFSGVLLIYVLNVLRVVALFASLRWHPGWFGPLHGVVAPTAIIFAGCLFFLVWANSVAKPERA